MAGLELILCPECGKDLSSLEPAYEYLTGLKKNKILQQKYPDIDASKLDMIPDIADFGGILDYLNLNKMCCRTHKIACAKIRHLYYGY